MTLTNQQRAFVEHYLTCWEGAEAARRAGYSEVGARVQAHRLLTNANIQEVIAFRLAELKMTADEVLLRLASHARGSMEDFVTVAANGDLELDWEKAQAAGKLHLVKKVNYDKDGNLRSVELYDAQSAAVQLGRHLQLFTDALDITSGGEKLAAPTVYLPAVKDDAEGE